MRITSPLANCLDGSKVEMECGRILEIRKNVKKSQGIKCCKLNRKLQGLCNQQDTGEHICGDNIVIFWLERSV